MSHPALTPVRPPDTDTLELPAAEELAKLSHAERLQLRVGLWLLLRAARRRAVLRDHTVRDLQLEQLRSRAQREHTALRTHALHTVRS